MPETAGEVKNKVLDLEVMLPCFLVCQRGKPLPSSEQECAGHCLPSVPAASELDPFALKVQQLCSLLQARRQICFLEFTKGGSNGDLSSSYSYKLCPT